MEIQPLDLRIDSENVSVYTDSKNTWIESGNNDVYTVEKCIFLAKDITYDDIEILLKIDTSSPEIINGRTYY